jgi:hypothetical protein
MFDHEPDNNQQTDNRPSSWANACRSSVNKYTALNLHRLTGADNIAEACRVTAFSADRGLNLLKNPQITRSQAC